MGSASGATDARQSSRCSGDFLFVRRFLLALRTPFLNWRDIPQWSFFWLVQQIDPLERGFGDLGAASSTRAPSLSMSNDAAVTAAVCMAKLLSLLY
jgi:hypothetical protein